MQRSRRLLRPVLPLLALLAVGTISCPAAVTLDQQIDPPEVNVGDEVTVTLTVHNGSLDGNVQLPPVDGLRVLPGISTTSQISFLNGSLSSSASIAFHLVPARAGDFTIPEFKVHTPDGQALTVSAMKLHVLENGAPATGNSTTVTPAPAVNPAAAATMPFNPNGPVAPPSNPAPDDNATGNMANVPVEADGRPAKVFVIITPETTDAYVGQAIPLRIDWYIRLDVEANQDSLPTIKGSDFLMNNLSVRPAQDERIIMNEAFLRQGWVTAISAPKSGDYQLQMERDSYWTKPPSANSNFDPFQAFFSRPQLAHESVPSNKFIVHVHALPTEGRPANFTGVIGHLTVSGSADPTSAQVGDPVSLHFTVQGDGNFDYVRCPSLALDPAWKSYVPTAKTEYRDESHTRAIKTFEQAAIPQKPGTLSLPDASFSYFDPTTKKYVTVSVDLPPITVTGTAVAAAPLPGNGDATSASPARAADTGFLPNRLELGSPQTSLRPVFRQPWFWAVQGGFLALPLLGALVLFLRPHADVDDQLAERQRRLDSRRQEQDTMAAAVARRDAVAFFLAARHAVQLKLGAQWRLNPESITLDQVRSRDPALAEQLGPLFTQADEVIYSGQAGPDLDLADWERHVRELLQPQPQPA